MHGLRLRQGFIGIIIVPLGGLMFGWMGRRKIILPSAPYIALG